MNISKLQKLNSAFNQGCTYIANKTPGLEEKWLLWKNVGERTKKVKQIQNVVRKLITFKVVCKLKK